MQSFKIPFLTTLLFFLYSFFATGQILQGSATLSSGNNMAVTVTVNTNTNNVDIELTGPSTVWHAVGFGGTSMNNTYSLVINGSGTINERKLGNHNSGTSLTSSITSSNTSTSAGVRTTVMTRPRVGTNNNYYTFPTNASSISLIWAKGSGSSLSYHGSSNRGSTIVSLTNLCNIPTTVLSNALICEGDSVMIFGDYQMAAGIYTDTLTTSIGCDSVLSKELIISPKGPFVSPSITICQGDSALILGNYQKVSGTYSDTLLNANSCDSIVSQQLIVTPVDLSLSVFSDSIYANAQNASYQWIDCSTGLAIQGETNQYFLPSVSGSYSVAITQNNCTDTSDCVNMNQINIEESTQKTMFDFFPNPADDQVTIRLNSKSISGTIQIADMLGKVLIETEVDGSDLSIDISSFPAGIYVLIFNSDDILSAKTLIIR